MNGSATRNPTCITSRPTPATTAHCCASTYPNTAIGTPSSASSPFTNKDSHFSRRVGLVISACHCAHCADQEQRIGQRSQDRRAPKAVRMHP